MIYRTPGQVGAATGKCPRCVTATMRADKLRGLDCERCSGCGGIWFDRDAYLGYGTTLGLSFPDPPGEPVPSAISGPRRWVPIRRP